MVEPKRYLRKLTAYACHQYSTCLARTSHTRQHQGGCHALYVLSWHAGLSSDIFLCKTVMARLLPDHGVVRHRCISKLMFVMAAHRIHMLRCDPIMTSITHVLTSSEK